MCKRKVPADGNYLPEVVDTRYIPVLVNGIQVSGAAGILSEVDRAAVSRRNSQFVVGIIRSRDIFSLSAVPGSSYDVVSAVLADIQYKEPAVCIIACTLKYAGHYHVLSAEILDIFALSVHAQNSSAGIVITHSAYKQLTAVFIDPNDLRVINVL